MCGIVGYVGGSEAVPFLVDGLRRLEYRGYDSAGVAGCDGAGLQVVKRAGRIDVLESALSTGAQLGHAGIAHTRWATHGSPTDANAHPHVDCRSDIGVVHNGIIENDQALREWLQDRGHRFVSQTDSEVLPHLIEHHLVAVGDIAEAIRRALQQVDGSYALAVLYRKLPDVIFAVRKESPLIIGLGDGENFIASDVPAVLGRTRRVLVLEDDEMAVVEPERTQVLRLGGGKVVKEVQEIAWASEQAEKGGYPHFMAKEIHEQPEALRAALRGRLVRSESRTGVDLSDSGWVGLDVGQLKKAALVACGTAYHACLVGKALLEQHTDLVVEADLASEFRYRSPRVGPDTLTVVVSQSGETADTLAALREAHRRGSPTLAITNVVGSSAAREAQYVLYTQAGPEIAVASTKAYLTQVACLLLLSVGVGLRRHTLDGAEASGLLDALHSVPEQLEGVLSSLEPRLERLAVRWRPESDMYYIGRGLDYAVAMEGQLKIKEIAYVHAEALAAGELKHGTLALIREGVPVVAVCTQAHLAGKTRNNVVEVKARGADIVALVTEGLNGFESVADAVLPLPAVPDPLAPLVSVVPLQLLAYHAAVARGCDVDQPRNLAKSVTVE